MSPPRSAFAEATARSRVRAGWIVGCTGGAQEERMNRFIQTIIIGLTLATAATPAIADEVAGPKGSNTKIYVPKGWKVDAAEEGSQAMLLAVHSSLKAGLLYVVVEAKNVEAAGTLIDGIVGKVVSDAKITAGGPVTVNGFAGLAFKATGKAVDDKKPVVLRALMLDTKSNHVLFAIAMVHTDVQAKFEPELKAALAGIKPAK
jgi:hypothetical protein